MLENPAGMWHAVLSLDAGGIIFEVKHGPYAPLAEADVMPLNLDRATRNDWYAGARMGDRLPCA